MGNKKLFVALLGCAVLAAGCKKIWEKDDLFVSSPETNEEEQQETVSSFDEQASDYQFSTEGAMFIHLKTNSITTENCDTNVAVSGTEATIKAAGTYFVDGALTDGQIKVDADSKTAVVKIVLNGADIASKSSAPLFVKNCKKAVLIINDGTQNSLTDGSENDKEGVLFSKENLAIAGATQGTGSLTITANATDGIKAKDGLVVKSGNITVNSAFDGIVGKDFVLVHGGGITVKSYGDALKSTDTGSGFVTIEDGEFNITCLSTVSASDTAKNDAIKAETDITISGGKFNIITKRTSVSKQGPMPGGGGGFNPWGSGGFEQSSNKLACMHALTCGRDLKISGGDFTINVYGKGLNADANIEFDKASVSIISERHGVSAEGAFTIKGGTLAITSNWEGIEATNISIEGGNTLIASEDDGVNASNTNPWIKISDGFLYVRSSGDGIDSNGNIEVTGGVTIVSQTGGGNSPIDCGDRGYSFTVDGGTVFAMGSKDMFNESIPSSTSLPMVYSLNLSSGTSLA
ncbi:MAG: carbohydrate-binding domain-containing protein, partial [Bacteroidales bacterium]|nr:carbohydrate-binding domain-containing protein [Bacteroidales bacterium]